VTLKILQTVAGISRASGGPSHSVTNLCSYLGHVGQFVNLLVIGDEANCDQWVLPDRQVVKLHCVPKQKIPFFNMSYSPEFGRKIAKLHQRDNLQIIHDHGLWMPNNKTSAEMAMRLGIPLIISARGMLEPWALKYHGWKKKIVWRAWQKAAIQSAAVLHATAVEEALNLRALGLKNPITVIPNGVDVPDSCAQHADKPERTVLFLSRIHPKKGILNLVKAWVQLNPVCWKLVIAGPDGGGHQVEIQKIIDDAGFGQKIELAGPVEGDAKWQLYEQASLFVLPSFSENFGIVVAEALATAVPVITTKGTPWSDLIKHECGWWIDVGVEPLEAALGDAMTLSDAERLAMGQRGRQLVQNNYSWPKIAADMSSTYRWILEGGTPPDCVRLD